MATYKEGEDKAGYWPDAKPETHKVSLYVLLLVEYSQQINRLTSHTGLPRAFQTRITQDLEGLLRIMSDHRYASLCFD